MVIEYVSAQMPRGQGPAPQIMLHVQRYALSLSRNPPPPLEWDAFLQSTEYPWPSDKNRSLLIGHQLSLHLLTMDWVSARAMRPEEQKGKAESGSIVVSGYYE